MKLKSDLKQYIEFYEKIKFIEDIYAGKTVIRTYVDGDKFISLAVHSSEVEITEITSHDEGSVQKEIAGKCGIYKAKSHNFNYVSEDKKLSIGVWYDSDQTPEKFSKLN